MGGGYFQLLGLPPPTIIKAIQAFSVISIKKGHAKKSKGGHLRPPKNHHCEVLNQFIIYILYLILVYYDIICKSIGFL